MKNKNITKIQLTSDNLAGLIRNKVKLTAFALLILVLLSGCSEKEENSVPASTVSVNNDKYISIVTLGDNLLHMPVINSGKQSDGTYDYSHLFAKLQPKIKEADIAVMGQETVFGGADKGYSGYPLFNSPSDMGKTLVKEGFDVVLHASNHILDKGVSGVENTLEFWGNYPEVKILGINNSQAEKEKVEIIEIKGARLALLNYTYGTNGLVLPSDKKYLVNYIDENKIYTDSVYAEENADFTIAFMHWGTEYSIKPDSFQKELAKKMCEWGVDLIIGSHPHVIEPVEWIETENQNHMLVYYSLGNFVSRQKETRNLLGAMADVTLKYDGNNVTIDTYKFVPIVTHYNRTYTEFAVYPLYSYNNELAALHGIAGHDGAASVERWEKMLNETFAGYDTECISRGDNDD